jgi:hypothetical protein
MTYACGDVAMVGGGGGRADRSNGAGRTRSRKSFVERAAHSQARLRFGCEAVLGPKLAGKLFWCRLYQSLRGCGLSAVAVAGIAGRYFHECLFPIQVLYR